MIKRMITSNKVSRDRGGIVAGGVDNGSPMFIKALFEATISFSDILKITFSTLNHVNHIRRFTSSVRFDLIHLSSTIKSILRAVIFDIRAGGTIIFIAPKRARRKRFYSDLNLEKSQKIDHYLVSITSFKEPIQQLTAYL